MCAVLLIGVVLTIHFIYQPSESSAFEIILKTADRIAVEREQYPSSKSRSLSLHHAYCERFR